MDLKEMWNGLDEDQFSGGLETSEALSRIRTASQHPLAKLRKGLKNKLWWGIGVGAALLLVWLLALLNAGEEEKDWFLAVGFLGFLVLLSLGSMIPVYKAWKSLPAKVDLSGDVLSVMKQYRDTVRRVITLEDKFSWFMAFPSPAVGALLGIMSDGESMQDIVDSGKIWAVIVIGVVVAPLVVWSTRKMNKIAFGKTLAEVEGYIEQLEGR